MGGVLLAKIVFTDRYRCENKKIKKNCADV
jgi:hypothetical protein